MVYLGYYGATYYKRTYINWYICYLCMNIFFNMLYLLYISSNHRQITNETEITNNQLIVNSAFSFVNLAVNSWIVKICYSFKRLLREVKHKNLISNLTAADSSFLHESSWNRRYLA